MNTVSNEGHRLAQYLENNVSTLDIHTLLLNDLKVFNSLVIVGSSWTGKTTIRNIFKELTLQDSFYFFPKRIITRGQRPNDNLDENTFATDLEDLKIQVHGGIIWERDLGETKEYYGFVRPPENTFPIYSANNALVRQKNNLIQTLSPEYLDQALIVLVYAPDEERLERNHIREGNYLDSKPLQKLTRLSDSADSLFNKAHIVIHNHNAQNSVEQKADLLLLLQSIKEIKNSL